MGYKAPRMYSIRFVLNSIPAPADSTTFYFGAIPISPTTTANIAKIYPMVRGRIIAASFHSYQVVGATAENVAISIRKNDTTDYAVSSQPVNTVTTEWANRALNIPLEITDFIEVKLVTPAWTTNPANMYLSGECLIECE